MTALWGDHMGMQGICTGLATVWGHVSCLHCIVSSRGSVEGLYGGCALFGVI